jgi:uncharacterized membrane protein
MTLRLALIELATQHRLDPPRSRELHALAGVDAPPTGLERWLPRGVAIAAAALGGLGLVVWIAANWDTLGRFGRFALLQGVVLVMCAGALARPAARAPLGLLALLAIGGLFAYFGQTYQTGADAWQLFALWAALALPLCLAIRSDLLWAPWALVAMSAVALWVQTHTGHRWRVEPDDLGAHLAGSVAAAIVIALLVPAWRRFTGAGAWSLRTAVTLAVVMVTVTALAGLFHRPVAPHYGLALLLLAMGAAAAAMPRTFEVYVLSAVSLALDTLLVAGLARLLFEGQSGEPIGTLFVIGLIAAGLIAGTVSAIMKLARRDAGKGGLQ